MKHLSSRTLPGVTGFKKLFCLLTLWLMASAGAWAQQDNATLVPLSLEERMSASDLVLEGKVISQKSFWDARHENIYTVNQVQVYKLFKGQAAGSTVEVLTEGGRVGLRMHVYSATLQLLPQQQGVFFLQQAPKGKETANRYQAYGSMQGFIHYKVDQKSARDPFGRYASIQGDLYPNLTRLSGVPFKTINPNHELEGTPKVPERQLRRAVPEISDFTPKSLRAGTADVLTITGNNFGATRGSGYVEFPDADDGGKSFIKPLDTDYISWSNTQIKVKVPTYGIDGGTAGTGKFRVVNSDPSTSTAASDLLIIFAYSNVGYDDDERGIPLTSYGPEHINQNTKGGYTFQFGASFEANKPALYAFKRSMNEWSCSTLINWDTQSGSNIARTADDNLNSVRFSNTAELPANVLGRTISRYAGCIIGKDVNFWVEEIDMEFSPSFAWQYGPDQPTNVQYDFESVTLHELGHAHQLSHLILPRAVMHYAVGRGQVSRTLSQANDIAGGKYVMNLNASAQFCEEPIMIPKQQNACSIPVETIVLQGTYQTGTNTVLLQWEVENEENVLTYVVERSATGNPDSYVEIGRVTAANRGTYQFTDPNPLPTLAYYRLRILKSNNTVEFSELAQVAGPEFTNLIFPNPGVKDVNLNFNTAQRDQLKLEFFDTAGRFFGALTIDVVPEVKSYSLQLPDLAPGYYIIRWTTGSQNGTFRFLKIADRPQ
ncbi:T9SS type A sorting domain-containing protein [Nibribacter ruber]|uniref:T9SS type A sorting domain-containing protein n=1 Tax=Nibribacter ruber TaxID=2698458 RepID=A0A6P1P0B9_9BACT|nr:T9SS type A sorting domain-containing protein [Nibribacter ruber]QHL88089.1 T9SS type A sorting domain-containing protein [Nibribacter ruber]